MTIMPLGGAVPGTDAGTATPAASLPSDQLGRETFLKLMVAQLRNQDPMNPQDSAEFLAQTAQFTSLEKLDAVAQQTSQALAAQMAFGASTLAGRSVTYLGEDGVTELTGTVDTVRFTATGPVLSVGGTEIPINNVLAVALQQPPASA
jgi:flagellar basal-body rod modification protein FlgD